MQFKDPTARVVLSDLNLHCPQKDIQSILAV